MDERRARLKSLKKAYAKQRRSAMWGWDALWYFSLALLILAVGLVLYMLFYKTTVVRILDLYIWTPVKELIGIRQNLLFVGVFVGTYGKWFVLGFAVLTVFIWIMRHRARNRTRRFDSYLDYMTLKNTFKTEANEGK